MGFADEVKEMGKSETVVEKKDELVTGEPSEIKFEGEQDPDNAVKEAQKEETVKQVESVSKDKPKAKIKIGTKEFDNQEEALSYAEELERQAVVDEAYRKGVKDALPKTDTVVQDEFEEFENELFSKPKEVLKKIYEKAKNDAAHLIKSEMTIEKEKEAFWNNFYKENPDLSSNQKFINESVLTKYYDKIAPLDIKTGQKKLAELARQEIMSIVEAAKPQKELISGSAKILSSNSTTETSKKPAQQETTLDFIGQLNQVKKRGKQLSV